jgi:hypothetical protein
MEPKTVRIIQLVSARLVDEVAGECNSASRRDNVVPGLLWARISQSVSRENAPSLLAQ